LTTRLARARTIAVSRPAIVSTPRVCFGASPSRVVNASVLVRKATRAAVPAEAVETQESLKDHPASRPSIADDHPYGSSPGRESTTVKGRPDPLLSHPLRSERNTTNSPSRSVRLPDSSVLALLNALRPHQATASAAATPKTRPTPRGVQSSDVLAGRLTVTVRSPVDASMSTTIDSASEPSGKHPASRSRVSDVASRGASESDSFHCTAQSAAEGTGSATASVVVLMKDTSASYPPPSVLAAVTCEPSMMTSAAARGTDPRIQHPARSAAASRPCLMARSVQAGAVRPQALPARNSRTGEPLRRGQLRTGARGIRNGPASSATQERQPWTSDEVCRGHLRRAAHLDPGAADRGPVGGEPSPAARKPSTPGSRRVA